MVDGEAVLEAMGAARVLGHVAADRAHLLARRIRARRRSRPARPQASRPGSQRPAATTTRWPSRSISRIRFIRASEMTTPSATGKAPPERPVPAPRATNGSPSRAHSRTTPALRRSSPASTTSAGSRPPAGEPVAVVHAQLLGLRDHVLVRRATARELGDDVGRQGHPRESTASRSGDTKSMIDYRRLRGRVRR